MADRHDAVLSLNTPPNGRLTVLLPRAESAGPGPVTTSRRELGHSGADGGGRWAIAGGSCRSAVAADPESAAPDDGVTLEWARERLRASPGAMLRSPSRTTRREPTRGPDQRRRRAAGYAAVGDCRAAPLAGDNAVGLQHVGTDQSVLAILTATDEATSERFHQRFQLSFIASSAGGSGIHRTTRVIRERYRTTTCSRQDPIAPCADAASRPSRNALVRATKLLSSPSPG